MASSFPLPARSQASRRPGRRPPTQTATAVRVAGVALVLTAAATACTNSSRRGTAAATTTSPATSSAGATTTTAAGGTAGGSSPAIALQAAFTAVVNKVRPSVVEITTGSGLGSGVVYDDKGDIVTNAHVVGSAAGTVQVKTLKGQTINAQVVGTYVSEDLAVVRASSPSGLTPATFADSAALQVGDIVFAIGNPLGLASSVTEGIVSFNGRTVPEGNGVTLSDTVQTSAAINPGNSGGALADLEGRVVGIPTLAASDPQIGGAANGIGFAIPANTITKVADQLIAKGSSLPTGGRAALGIQAATAVTPDGQPAGVVIAGITPAGAAAAAGLAPGDVITAINGRKITSLADLQGVLQTLRPGDKATVAVTHPDGTNATVTVTLGTLPG